MADVLIMASDGFEQSELFVPLEKLREAGHKPVRREGTREGRWTLLDYVDIVVHVANGDHGGVDLHRSSSSGMSM